MTDEMTVQARSVIAAPAAEIFELIADPARQPDWDGNDNLAQAEEASRVRAVGDTFAMTLTNGQTRDNHVVEFDEGRLIAWRPSDQGKPPAGHLWRWEVTAIDDNSSEVTHTYDWSELTDERRLARAKATTSAQLQASVDRLASLFQ